MLNVIYKRFVAYETAHGYGFENVSPFSLLEFALFWLSLRLRSFHHWVSFYIVDT